jgi:isochorismate pyruvate lyase
LGEVRTNIDRIDDQILRLMAERSRYVAQAERFKTSAATVRDETRIRQILTRIREKAARQGVNPDIAEATFRAMVEGFNRPPTSYPPRSAGPKSPGASRPRRS